MYDTARHQVKSTRLDYDEPEFEKGHGLSHTNGLYPYTGMTRCYGFLSLYN
jgi:hypothetical protein